MTIMYISFGLLYGFGGCCVYNSVFVVVPSYFYKRRALAIGLIAAGPGAGVFVMTTIIHNLINAVGWRKTFMVLAGIVAPISLTGCCFAPYNDPEQLAVEEPKIEHKRDCNFQFNNIFNVSIWKIPTFTVITLSRAVAHIGELTPVTHMVSDNNFGATNILTMTLTLALTPTLTMTMTTTLTRSDIDNDNDNDANTDTNTDIDNKFGIDTDTDSDNENNIDNK